MNPRQWHQAMTISQRGDAFEVRAEHIHPADLGRKLKAEISVKVKEDVKRAVFQPAMDVVETALLEMVENDDLIIPKKNLMKRVANRHRSKMRPQEPKDFEFEVNQDYLQCEEFMISDIRVDQHRHFLLATENNGRYHVVWIGIIHGKMAAETLDSDQNPTFQTGEDKTETPPKKERGYAEHVGDNSSRDLA